MKLTKVSDRQGQADKIKQTISELQAEMGAFIRARINSQAEAEDLLQELWFQLSKTIQHTEIANIRAWLYRVARNKIIDSYRKKSPEWLEDYLTAEWGEEDYEYDQQDWLTADDSTETAFLREAFWAAFYDALESLPQKQKDVFVLNELEGITLREIAENQHENLKTIISRKGYAVRQLRNRLEIWLEELIED